MKSTDTKTISFLDRFKKQKNLLTPPLIKTLLTVLGTSLRVSWVETEKKERPAPAIYAFWHGQQLGILWTHRYRSDLEVLVSQSRDGEILAQVLKKFQISCVRGSSSKGGPEALEEMLYRISAGQSIAIAPDGPKGPSGHIAPGVVALARWSQAPIIPVAIAFNRAWKLSSWDQFLIPWPGSKMLITYGSPIFVRQSMNAKEAAQNLAETLNTLTAYLSKRITLKL